ncbi:MAG: SRPBCC family protein [Micropruina sp.]|uniref:SRPBCC family protein n=1 Tax=Micropruina sp. TaxID=2737536 RepID=UPI0039E5982B
MISETRETSLSPDAVWSRLVDIESWPSWSDSMERIERLDDGPLRVGAKARVTQPAGRPAVWEVTVLDADREFTWQSRQPGVTVIARHLLSPTADGTHIVLTLDVVGPLAWLGQLLAGRRIARYVRMEADGLARTEPER